MRLPDGQRLMLLRPHRRERHIQLVSNSDGLARAIDAPGRYNRRMLGSAPEEYDRRRLTVQRFIFKKQIKDQSPTRKRSEVTNLR